MPRVGNKKYAYTKTGVAAAKKASKKTRKKVTGAEGTKLTDAQWKAKAAKKMVAKKGGAKPTDAQWKAKKKTTKRRK